MSDPVKEAVERLEDDLSRAREDGLVLTDAPRLRTALAELSRLSRLVEVDRAVIEAAHDLVMKPGGLRMTPTGTYIVEKADRSDPHYRLCKAFEDRASLTHKAISGGGE